MGVELSTPDPSELDAVVADLRDWQRDDAPIQLHPGDLGWFWRFGPAAMAAALRVWRRDGQLAAIGLLDGAEVLRLTVAPGLWREDELARHVVADLADPARGVLPDGKVAVEAPDGTLVRDLLDDAGWSAGEAWTPLRIDLADAAPVREPITRIETVEGDRVPAFTAVHRSAWGSQSFTDGLWQTMAAGAPFADARCLLGYDEDGAAVAGVTVWGAGAGRPGLIEPLGVHSEHRRNGYARAICVGAANTLREMGSSSALVCTQSNLASAVATYRSAGFELMPERLDRTRDA